MPTANMAHHHPQAYHLNSAYCTSVRQSSGSATNSPGSPLLPPLLPPPPPPYQKIPPEQQKPFDNTSSFLNTPYSLAPISSPPTMGQTNSTPSDIELGAVGPGAVPAGVREQLRQTRHLLGNCREKLAGQKQNTWMCLFAVFFVVLFLYVGYDKYTNARNAQSLDQALSALASHGPTTPQ